VIAFKIGRDPLAEAQALLAKGAWMVMTNTPASMGTPDGSYRIVTAKDKAGKALAGTKEEIAAALWHEILSGTGITKKSTIPKKSRVKQ